LVGKIKTGMTKNSTFIHSDFRHAKVNTPLQNESKKRKKYRWNLDTKNDKSNFIQTSWYNRQKL
jgi:hypothetical protein